jgi:hypothetical protein
MSSDVLNIRRSKESTTSNVASGDKEPTTLSILKVEENTNWRLRLLIICSIESESQILGWANRNANGKGTRRNEEKRNIQIEYYVCLLVPLVTAILQFRLTPKRLSHCQSF